MTADQEALERYVGTARWFGGKGREFSVREVRRAGVLGEAGSSPQVGIELVTLEYGDGDTEIYQVPLAYYAKETNDPSLEPAPLLKKHAAEGKTFASLAAASKAA